MELRRSSARFLLLCLALGAVCRAQPIRGMRSDPASSYSMQNSLPDPYGRNIAPYFNNQEYRQPDPAWASHQGEVAGKADDGLWLVSCNGVLPRGSIVSLQRNGVNLNGGQVIESGAGTALIRPWSSQDIKLGDQVILQSVAPPPSQPVYDKFQVNRPTMQDPTYLQWTDTLHREHPGQMTSLFNGYGFHHGYNSYYYRH